MAEERSTPSIAKKTSRKRSNDKTDSVLETIEQHFKKPKTKDDRYDILGKNVALKMKDISSNNQRLLAEKIINEALFMAEMGELTMSHAIRNSNNLNNVSTPSCTEFPTSQNFSIGGSFSQPHSSTYYQLQPPVVNENNIRSNQSLASYVSSFDDH